MPVSSRSIRRDQYGRARIRALGTVLVCVLVGLAVTAAVTVSTLYRVRLNAANETDNRLVATGAAIDRQVSRYAETLYGLRTDFARNPGLTRDDFRDLVDIESLTRRNPGAESVTFNRLVPASGLASFVARTRREIRGFTVFPVTAQADHVVVDYVAPDSAGPPVLGLDIAADPIRRAAMEFARDSGELSATTPLTLVQPATGPGFLLMLAAYDVSPVPVTAPARMRHFLGVLVAVFAADTMVAQSVESRTGMAVSIYDAGPTVDVPRAVPRPGDWVVGQRMTSYSNYADIDVGSRRWRLVTRDPLRTSLAAPIAAATTGTALTLLVAGLLTAMSLSRRRAVKLAEQMTADLVVSQDRLRAANETMRGFIDVAAHDLRSPLASIGGFSALLRDDELNLSEADRAKALESIERQTVHMSRLIEDLLTMSSIDGGGLLSRPAPTELASAIRDCLEAIGGGNVTVVCPPGLLVLVDPDHLRRILDNYLQNALKYGAEPVRVEAEEIGSLVEVRVTDQGQGVPAEFVPRLFDMFARADAPASKGQKGTGLGLSIVRGLAVANGGQALYRENSPHGSCFIVRLPAARA